MTRYVVAVSKEEAEDFFWDCGLNSRAEAEELLEKLRKPLTDPYYASQYKIYKIEKDTK